MNLSKVYYLCSSLLFFLAAFIILSPGLISPDFIYPKRVDSLYVVFHTEKEVLDSLFEEHPEEGLFTPNSLGIPYEPFEVHSYDGALLRGWLCMYPDTPANTIILIHDLNQSKILLLDQIKQFYDRGMNVLAMDLRAHGTSEGTEFSPGIPAVKDFKIITDSLLSMEGSNHLILFGMGLGAGIALQLAVYDGRSDVIILQSPFNNLKTYLDRYIYYKWGSMSWLWKAVFLRQTERLLGYHPHDLNLSLIARYTETPTLFISPTDDNLTFTTEVLAIHDSSAARRKSLFLVKGAGRQNAEEIGGPDYYNRITEFINSALPKKTVTTKLKKLAFNDNERLYRPDF